MRRVGAVRLTEAGRRWLDQSNQVRILHIFEQVCNLINDGNQVLSIQVDPVPPSPVSLSLPAQAFDMFDDGGFVGLIHDDSRITLEPGKLRLEDMEIVWAQAEQWDPAPDWAALRSRQEDWLPRLDPLVPLLLKEAPANSLAPLLAHELSQQQETDLEMMAAVLLSRARGAANELQGSLRSGEQTAAKQAAAALAGLGGGLTPSGDDYLMGVMHALWATREQWEANHWSEVISQSAVERTVPLSATWLRAAAQGSATGSWHQLTQDLLLGNERQIQATTRQIMKIGHSSGADGLAGFIQTLI